MAGARNMAVSIKTPIVFSDETNRDSGRIYDSIVISKYGPARGPLHGLARF